MRALLVLFYACTMPRDHLGDERVIDVLTPLYTDVEPATAVRGARVHITATLSDPEYRENIGIEVMRCPDVGTSQRDIQCLATKTEEIIRVDIPTRDDELVIYTFDYEVPNDLPLNDLALVELNGNFFTPPYYTERVMVRATSGKRITTQIANIEVLPVEPYPPIESKTEALTPTLEGKNKSYSLTEGVINLMPSGLYFIKSSGFSFFCTPGCFAPEREPGADFNLPLTLSSGASPHLYLLGFGAGLKRYVLQATD